MARKIGTIPCSVKEFVRNISYYDDERKTRIKELGFEGMLSLKPVKMRKNLLNCLIDLYDPVKERVTFGSGESFSIYPYDIEIIMGLKDKGTIVQLDEQISPEDVPEQYNVNHTRRVISIKEIVRIMDDEGPPNEEFDRSFVLFLTSNNLSPSTDGYTYWEKVRPWESNFFFSGRTTPLVKYWDEDVAYKRDMYDISYGRSCGMVLDDLRKVPTIDQLVHCDIKHKDMITPISMVSNNSEEVIHVSKRLTYVENILAVLMKKDETLGRCLE